MAAPSPRSHLCRPAAAQPGCSTASASAPQHGSQHSQRAGRRGWAGGGGLLQAPSILESCSHPPPPWLRTEECKGLCSQVPLNNSSAPVPRTDKRLRPPPHACAGHTLHGDGRVALLGVLGTLHLQLLGRERPIRGAHGGLGWGGKDIAQGHGVLPHPSCTLISPPSHSPVRLEATHGCWGGGCTGCCLAGSSSSCTQRLGCSGSVGHPGTGPPAPQQPWEAAGPIELNSLHRGGAGGHREPGCSHRGPRFYRGAKPGDAASRR